MPVHKRAARPTAASASDDPRDPQPSDNDFTVLFRRVSARDMPPPQPRIEAPKRPPRPPVAARPSRRPGPDESGASRDRPTPLVMATPAMAIGETGTVTVRLPMRALFARMTLLLTVGCAAGVGVEMLLQGQLAGSWSEHGASPSRDAAQAPPSSSAQAEGSAASSADERVAVARVVHHHHVHRAAPAVSRSTPAVAARDDEASPDGGDDLAAAMQTLTKAKEEVTLP